MFDPCFVFRANVDLLVRLLLGLSLAFGADTPVNDLSFIDFEAQFIGSLQARLLSHGTINVGCLATIATNDMVVVVANSIFIKCRCARGLDAANQAFFSQHPQGVINSLFGYGTNLCPHFFSNLFCRAVRARRYGPHHGESLGGYLNATFPQQLSQIIRHGGMLRHVVD